MTSPADRSSVTALILEASTERLMEAREHLESRTGWSELDRTCRVAAAVLALVIEGRQVGTWRNLESGLSYFDYHGLPLLRALAGPKGGESQ